MIYSVYSVFIMLFELVILCFMFVTTQQLLRCSQINKPLHFDYHVTQTCTKSSQNVIARKFTTNLEHCKSLTTRLKGLAFNYAPADNLEIMVENCIIYDCPEFNVTSLKQFDSPYHYYSAYARIYPAENMTCVPKEGIYMFSEEKLNYTQALAKCQANGGTLANIITEEATTRASNIIAKSKIGNNKKIQAYVGLNDMQQEGKFVTINGEPLNCISFRSWAPSEPKNKYTDEDCVTIDSMRYWRVHKCNQTLPYICEIAPNGPLNLTQAYCTHIEDENMKKECYDYLGSTEIDVENETCNRTSENLETIRERID